MCFRCTSPQKLEIKKKYSLATKQLHTQQSKDHNEEEEEEEKADDRLHGVQQGHHQVPQRVPVPTHTHI